MATIIDEFFLAFGFDTSGLEAGGKKSEKVQKGVRDDADKTAKQLEAAGKKAASFFTSLHREALGFLGALTAANGIKDFVKNVTGADIATGRLAHNLNISTRELSAWEITAERAGGSADGIAGTLSNLSQSIQQFKITGNSPLISALSLSGTNLTKFLDDSVSVSDKALIVADALQAINKVDPARAAAIGAMFGADPATIALFERGAKALREANAENGKYAVNEQDVKAAQERVDAWEQLKSQVMAFGRAVLTEATPAIVKLLKRLSELTDENWGAALSTVVDAIRQISAWLSDEGNWKRVIDDAKGLGAALWDVGRALQFIIDQVGGVENALEILLAFFVGKWALGILSSLAGVSRAFGEAFLKKAALEAAPKATAAALEDAAELLPVVVTSDVIAAPLLAAAAGAGIAYGIDKVREESEANHEGLDFDHTNYAGDGPIYTTDDLDKREADNARTAGDAEPFMQRLREIASFRPRGSLNDHPYAEAQSDITKLVAMGWTRAQATGIVANIQGESAGNTEATGDLGRAYGLLQWHPDRQANFEKWTGHSIQSATRDEQLAFINQEYRYGGERKAGEALSKAQTATDAAAVVAIKGERSADPLGDAAKRQEIALKLESGAGASVGGVVNLPPVYDGGILSGASAAAADTSSRQALAGPRAQAGDNIDNDINISSIIIHTQATDAKAIAASIGSSLRNNTLVAQANGGLR